MSIVCKLQMAGMSFANKLFRRATLMVTQGSVRSVLAAALGILFE